MKVWIAYLRGIRIDIGTSIKIDWPKERLARQEMDDGGNRDELRYANLRVLLVLDARPEPDIRPRPHLKGSPINAWEGACDAFGYHRVMHVPRFAASEACLR